MELVQIEMVGVEPFERPVQFEFGSFGVTLTRFACQEYFAPIGLQSIAQLDLGLSVPIRRGDVVIVDAAVICRGDDPVGGGLLVADDDDTSKPNHGQLNAVLIRAAGIAVFAADAFIAALAATAEMN